MTLHRHTALTAIALCAALLTGCAAGAPDTGGKTLVTPTSPEAAISALQGVAPGDILDDIQAAEAATTPGAHAYETADGTRLLILDGQQIPQSVLDNERAILDSIAADGTLGEHIGQYVAEAEARLGRTPVIALRGDEGSPTRWVIIGAPGQTLPIQATEDERALGGVEAAIANADNPDDYVLIVRP